MAHADAEMTEYYQSGHSDKDEWCDVEAGLKLDEILL